MDKYTPENLEIIRQAAELLGKLPFDLALNSNANIESPMFGKFNVTLYDFEEFERAFPNCVYHCNGEVEFAHHTDGEFYYATNRRIASESDE